MQIAAKASPCLTLGRFSSSTARKAVVMRAKEMREYREDTGEVTVSGDEKNKQQDQQALYADEAQQMVSPLGSIRMHVAAWHAQ